MARMADFAVIHAGVLIVGLIGEVDVSDVEELEQTIDIAAHDDVYGIVVDLGRVTYLETAVLELFNGMCRRLARRNVELHLVLPGDQHIRGNLRLVELPRSLSVHDSIEGARQAALAHTAEVTTALAEHLRIALTARDTIGMAKGIIIATRGWCTPDEAFDILRRESQNRNVKLRDLAQELVDLATKNTRRG